MFSFIDAVAKVRIEEIPTEMIYKRTKEFLIDFHEKILGPSKQNSLGKTVRCFGVWIRNTLYVI
jgi:hypothetical protein